MRYKAPRRLRRVTQADYIEGGRALARDCAEDVRRGLVPGLGVPVNGPDDVDRLAREEVERKHVRTN